MVRKALEVVYKEIRGLHQAAYVVALFTVGSQVLALVRDRLLAHQFGAGTELDLYYAAFRIPDLLYVLFASALSVYVLIPFVSEHLEKKGGLQAKRFLSQVYSLFLIAYGLLALTIGIFAPKLIPFVFPGFVEHTEQLTLLIRVLLLQPLFLGVSSLCSVVTQLHKRFVLYALSPLVYNIGIILGILFLYPYFGLSGITIGVVLGAVAHVAIQLPFVRRSELIPQFTLNFDVQEMFRVLRTSIPRALTLSLHQFVLLGLVGFASSMAVGSVSVFQFGFNLQSVPLAIIGVSYSVAAFPTLARLYSESKFPEFSAFLLTALRHVIFWSLPVIALLVVIRAQFVRVILGTGAFDWNDTRLTAAVFALFVISMVAQSISLLLVRALYATGNTKVPLIVTLCSSVGIFVAAFVLYSLFITIPSFQFMIENTLRLSGVPGTEVVALALGYTIVVILHGLILLIISARLIDFSLRVLLIQFLKALVAALVAGFVAYSTLNLFVESLRTETLLAVFTQGLLAGSIGILGAGVTYYLLGSQELKDVFQSFHRLIFKSSVPAPQDEDTLSV